jgi:hypothetical protein
LHKTEGNFVLKNRQTATERKILDEDVRADEDEDEDEDEVAGEGLETSDTGADSEDDDSGTEVDPEAFVRHAFTILYKAVAIQDMYVRHGVSTARRR